jgi:hypothetical protein
MGELNDWLQQATRHLAKDSAAEVRAEIREHYQSAREAAIAGGATSEDAERQALNALGDAKTANCQYRRVLLTLADARMLRQSNWEARAVCSRSWLKRLILAMPLAIAAAAAALLITGHVPVARDVLIGGIGVSPLVAILLLPINTPRRGLIFRCVKWVVLTGAVLFLIGPTPFTWTFLFSGLWPLVWIEWRRASIRRKLPVKAWPRHLYF